MLLNCFHRLPNEIIINPSHNRLFYCQNSYWFKLPSCQDVRKAANHINPDWSEVLWRAGGRMVTHSPLMATVAPFQLPEVARWSLTQASKLSGRWDNKTVSQVLYRNWKCCLCCCVDSCLWWRNWSRTWYFIESKLPGLLQAKQRMCLENTSSCRIHSGIEIPVIRGMLFIASHKWIVTSL